jgi:hypothetical protein
MNICKIIIIIVIVGLVYYLFFNKTDEGFGPLNVIIPKFLPKKEDISLINIDQPVQVLSGLNKIKDNEDKSEFLLKPYPNENYKIDMYTPNIVYKEVSTHDKNNVLEFLKKDIPSTFKDYKLNGIISNKYYQQYFILYKKPYIKDDKRIDNLVEYILVQKINDELKIIHKIPPRSEILDGDTMYFNYGNFSLGPFVFV